MQEGWRTSHDLQWVPMLISNVAGTELLPQLPAAFICSHWPQPWTLTFSIPISYCTDSSLTCVLPSNRAVFMEIWTSLKTYSYSPNPNEISPLIATLNMSSLFRAETTHWAAWITDAFHCEELQALLYCQRLDAGCLNASPSPSAATLNVQPQPPHLNATSPRFWNTSKDGDCPPCAAVPPQHCSLEKKLSLISNLNLPWWNPQPPPLILQSLIMLHVLLPAEELA